MQEVNAHLIKHFYDSFKHGNFTAMGDCYHEDAQFSDPVFPSLGIPEVKAMWHMLVQNGAKAGLQISYGDIQVYKNKGQCNWEATYTFLSSGRSVHNLVQAEFEFKGGLIVKHSDQFDFYRWTRMAFGSKGLLLGWTPFFKNKVQLEMGKRLGTFISRHTEYATS